MNTLTVQYFKKTFLYTHARYFQNSLRESLLRSPNRRICQAKIQTFPNSFKIPLVITAFYKQPATFYNRINASTDNGKELQEQLREFNKLCGRQLILGAGYEKNISLPRLTRNFSVNTEPGTLDFLFNQLTRAFWEYLGEETPDLVYEDFYFADPSIAG